VEALGAVVEEVGVTAGAVGGEVRDAQGELVQIEGVFGDSELKMEGEIGGFTLRGVYRAGGWEGAVQPAYFEACVSENAGGLRFRLEQDSGWDGSIMVDGNGDGRTVRGCNSGPSRSPQKNQSQY
jgi:hypothetical protein